MIGTAPTHISSDKLAERIASVEAEAAKLQTELDQAERAAEDFVTDPDQYDAASQEAREIRGRLSLEREKLERLERALAAAAERELAERIERLHGKQKKLAEKSARDQKQALSTIKAEIERHNAAIVAANAKFWDAAVAAAEVYLELNELTLLSARQELDRAEHDGDAGAIKQCQSALSWQEQNRKKEIQRFHELKALATPQKCGCDRNYVRGPSTKAVEFFGHAVPYRCSY